MTSPVSINITPHSKAWHLWRRTGIGGSDSWKVAGIKGPGGGKAKDVWEEKCGDPGDRIITPQMIRGTVLEPVMTRAYAIKNGYVVGPEYCVQHPQHKWMITTPDGQIMDRKKHVQVKTHLHWLKDGYGEQGTDEVPDHELVQVKHELAVTQHDTADIAVCFSAEETFEALMEWYNTGVDIEKMARWVLDKMDFRTYTIERDTGFEKDLIELEQDFWHTYVLTRVPPPDMATLQNTQIMRPATEDEVIRLEEFKRAYIGLKRAEKAYDACQEIFKEEIIGEDKGIYHGKEKVTYNKPKNKTKVEIDYDAACEELGISKEAWRKAVDKTAKTKAVTTERKLTVPWRAWKKEV